MKRSIHFCALVLVLGGVVLQAQQVPVQEYVLKNGLRLLMVPRKGDPNVAAGWIARVGSVNERPGITGLSHLFEHMMFKGTNTIGTTDGAKNLEVIRRLDAVKAEIRKEEEVLVSRFRLGEIADLTDPKNRSPKHQQLLQEFAALEKQEKDLLVKNEFDKIYTTAGASGMNAGTTNDFTVYFINVPANKLELWFWMESDRLLNPVFREFYSERDVVREERRMRTESTPTGKFEEQFDSLFWTSSPYGWPVVGWPSDLEGITREEAQAYFDVNYAPNNLTACLVGDFDPARARELADLYLGRLKAHPQGQPSVRTREVAQEAEKRMIAYADTNPEVAIRYHSVADGHVDEPALMVMGSILNGRTGRLYKSLVLDQKIANSAAAGHNGLKWDGFFMIGGVAKPGKTPEEVEKALYAEIDRLKKEKVPDRELRKVKNRFAADNFRRLQSPFALMIQLLMAESNRGWRSFNEDPKLLEAVTQDDIQRVANRYFKPENRAVVVYYTKKSDAPPDPALEGLTEQERAQVQQLKAMLAKAPAEQVKAMLQQVQQQEGAVPPEKRKFLELVKKLLLERVQKEGGR
jgi:predicted Zn-dependent peptidase